MSLRNVLSQKTRFETGDPQGAVISPTLYNIITADILKGDHQISILTFSRTIVLQNQ